LPGGIDDSVRADDDDPDDSKVIDDATDADDDAVDSSSTTQLHRGLFSPVTAALF